MTVWTVQPLTALDEIKRTGTYRCRQELSYNLSKTNSLKRHYQWLISQMEAKIGDRPSGVAYPVWAWHTWDYMRECPDPDSAAFLQRTEDKVLLTLEIPQEELVLTDFDAWQTVMMNSYLMGIDEIDRQDELEEYLTSLSEEEYGRIVQKSWERVFDTAPSMDSDMQKGRYVQATFWEIKEAYITDYQIFRAAV